MFRNRIHSQNTLTFSGRENISALNYLSIFIRSAVYNILFYTLVPLIFIVFSPLLLLKSSPHRFANRFCRFVLWLLNIICRLDYKIEGLENVPETGCVLASKHQSAWDTIIYFCLFPNVAYVSKKELFSIPIYGQFSKKLGSIGIDRQQGRKAIFELKRQSSELAAQNRNIVIFPEGSRTSPGEKREYNKGTYLLYKHLNNYPIVPVALNSGLFWGRRGWIKWPGTITLKFLPQVPQGLDANEFIEHLANSIENETNTLIKKVVNEEAR